MYAYIMARRCHIVNDARQGGDDTFVEKTILFSSDHIKVKKFQRGFAEENNAVFARLSQVMNMLLTTKRSPIKYILNSLYGWKNTERTSDCKKRIYVCRGGIFKQAMRARNRVGIGLSYRPARLIGWRN
jgi:hypothetical protein